MEIEPGRSLTFPMEFLEVRLGKIATLHRCSCFGQNVKMILKIDDVITPQENKWALLISYFATGDPQLSKGPGFFLNTHKDDLWLGIIAILEFHLRKIILVKPFPLSFLLNFLVGKTQYSVSYNNNLSTYQVI